MGPDPVGGQSLTIVEGTSFCICDELGDIGSFEASGFFDDDTRFLSLLRLTIDGEHPLLLDSRNVDPFSASFYLRNPIGNGLAPDTLLVSRERFVAGGMLEQIAVRNETGAPVTFGLELELSADFTDILTVKDRDFSLVVPETVTDHPQPAEAITESERVQLVFRDASDGHGCSTRIVLSREGEVTGGVVRYRVELEPRSHWGLTVYVHPSSQNGAEHRPRELERRVQDELQRVRDSLGAWQRRAPRLEADWDALRQVFEQSTADLAALRIRRGSGADLPAAGVPWFMTVFGRDTIITCLQTMLFGPELARAALHTLAELQATEDDPSIDAEPGKILHELRHGKAVHTWFARYYGTVDATPLFLVLLSEAWRWTRDDSLVQELRGPAMLALDWIDRYGDRDGDGFVEYERRSERGIANQSWKDSHDSQRFADGRYATGPIAPCEVQGYVYDAKRRLAELAREVWLDDALSDRLDREAEELRDRFDDAYWLPARRGYYALALDGDKRQVDAMCSNIGHLLWSGIVPPERVRPVVDRLFGHSLWSGWGVRTMSAADAAYSPLAYHNGSVWPHDNSLIAWGLARYGLRQELGVVARGMLEAAIQFANGLPEVFAGLPRAETPFPIPYPTPAKPQAWAAATPVLLVRLLLGLEPDANAAGLVSVAPALPDWLGDLSLLGVRALDRGWDVHVEDGSVRVEHAE